MNKNEATFVIDRIQRLNDNLKTIIINGSICLDDYCPEALRGVDEINNDSKRLREFIMDSQDNEVIERFKRLDYSNIIKLHELSPGILKYEYILQISVFIDKMRDVQEFIEKMKERFKQKTTNLEAPDIYSWIIGDENKKKETLKVLKEGIDNKTAKDGCKWIKAALKSGAMIKPPYTIISKEFPSIKKTPYNNQMKRMDDDSEIEPLIRYFK